MSFLGWSIIFEEKNVIGYKSDHSGDLWFVDSANKEQSDYDCVGVNHISIRVGNQKDVDKSSLFLQKKNINMLFNTPRHRPEYVSHPDMFPILKRHIIRLCLNHRIMSYLRLYISDRRINNRF